MGSKTFEAWLIARHARELQEAKRDEGLNLKARVFIIWKGTRECRMAEEQRAEALAELMADAQRELDYKQRLRDQVCKLQVQLARLEIRTGVRREAIDRADYAVWLTSMTYSSCGCAEDCVGECIAKVLDAAWAC